MQSFIMSSIVQCSLCFSYIFVMKLSESTQSQILSFYKEKVMKKVKSKEKTRKVKKQKNKETKKEENKETNKKYTEINEES